MTTAITLKTLIQHATQGTVRELELLSMEGGFYLLRAQLTNETCRVVTEQGHPLKLRSTTELRDHLHAFPALPCVLVQHVAHDEMCGHREDDIAPLRIPFTLAQQF